MAFRTAGACRHPPPTPTRWKRRQPLDNNTSLVWSNGVMCIANLGFTHPKPEEADRTVVCMPSFDLP